MPLNRSEIAAVIEDIEFFRTDWADGIEDSYLRRGSAALRSLLVNGNLGDAWRSLGFEKEPNILAVYLDDQLADLNLGAIRFAAAGGARNEGLTVSSMSYAEGKVPEKMPTFTEKEAHLSKYVSSICLIANGKAISRSEVIQYIANTKGGVHLGAGRSKARQQAIIQKVSRVENSFSLANKDALFFELLSIGQSVANSPDILRMESEFRSFSS